MANPAIVVTRMTEGDDVVVAEGSVRAPKHDGYPTTGDEMRSRLAAIGRDSNFHTLVAQVGGAVVGVAGVGLAPYYERNGIYGRLLAIAVTESHRGYGVGRALVDAAEIWLAERSQRAGYKSTGIRFVKELKPRP